jgi:hypothetical protein
MSVPDPTAVASGSMPPEWELLELISQDAEDRAVHGAFAQLAEAGDRWGELVDHALRHRMLPMVAHAAVRTNAIERMPIRLAEHLHTVLAANRYRRSVWYEQVGRVALAMAAAGIDTVARKGAAYESTVYAGNGSRWLGDVDILVRPEDKERIGEVLEELGYRQGLYDFRAERVAPFSREELIRYRLNADHLPTYTLVTGDPLVPFLEVDTATSLTWARAPYQVDVGEVLAGRESVVVGVAGREVVVPRASPEYQFLDTVLHLFREAWFEWWLEKEQDVDLMKFGDVLRLSRAYREQLAAGRFRDLVARHGVGQPACWVLEHLDRTFGTAVIQDLGLAKQVSERFLASAAATGADVAVWHADMRARLYTRDRRQLLAR